MSINNLHNKNYLDHLVESAPIGIILVNIKGDVIAWNKKTKAIFGKKGCKNSENTDLQKFIISSAFKSKKPLKKIISFRCEDGRELFLEIIRKKINLNGKEEGILIMLQDITQRIIAEKEHEIDHVRVNQMLLQKHALWEKAQKEVVERKKIEEELKKSKDQLEAIIQNVEDGIIVRDIKGNPIYANKSAAKILSYSTIDILLKTTLKSALKKYEIHNESGEFISIHDLPIWKASKGELNPQKILQFHDLKSGSRRWLNVKAKPVFDKKGRVRYTVNIVSDITERKHEEYQRDMFIGFASHELRNTLAGIKGFIQLLEKQFIRKKDNKSFLFLNKVGTNVDKLTKLINDLLDITKVRAGKLDFYDHCFDFDKLVDEIIEDIQATTTRRIIKKGRVSQDIKGDENRLGQVLTNLISNALKFSPEDAKVIIHVIKNTKEVKVGVQDFGAGIKKENKTKIFEPYYQIENPYIQKSSGLGLGLYLSKEIIKHYRGNIWVESNESKGSTFYFNLPGKTFCK